MGAENEVEEADKKNHVKQTLGCLSDIILFIPTLLFVLGVISLILGWVMAPITILLTELFLS